MTWSAACSSLLGSLGIGEEYLGCVLLGGILRTIWNLRVGELYLDATYHALYGRCAAATSACGYSACNRFPFSVYYGGTKER